jgi:hypothetical protein
MLAIAVIGVTAVVYILAKYVYFDQSDQTLSVNQSGHAKEKADSRPQSESRPKTNPAIEPHPTKEHENLPIDREDKLTEKDDVYKPKHQGNSLLALIDGNPYKAYTVKLKKGQSVVIRMKSKTLDSVVVVEDAKKNVLAFNDDDPDGGTVDSKLVWTAPEEGEWRIIATCFIYVDSQTKYGNFHLTIE